MNDYDKDSRGGGGRGGAKGAAKGKDDKARHEEMLKAQESA